MSRTIKGILLTIGVFMLISLLKKQNPYKLLIETASTAAQWTKRGLRNKNPGNIRISKTAWRGKVPADKNTDGVFEQFENPEDGIHAISTLITNYGKNYGANTISKIISRYAPSNENDTNAYIAAVEKNSGIYRDQPLNLAADPEARVSIVAAIIKQENGIQPYTADVLRKGAA